ncbi:hypothetical protein SNE40_006082 [Patella caerulea]|uniref:Uncharacterized protein n=1 Tax=Patella caerulea TaxID=87958 RepID=A0AAN8JZN0_PATCE
MSFCTDIGFNVESVFSDIKPNVRKLNNGAILEIMTYGKTKEISTKAIVKTLCDMCKIDSANVEACIAKINRVIQTDKKKRFDTKNEYRLEPFHIPVSSITTTRPVQESPTIQKLPQEKHETLGNVKEANRGLKRKLQRREDSLERKVSSNTLKLEQVIESVGKKV